MYFYAHNFITIDNDLTIILQLCLHETKTSISEFMKGVHKIIQKREEEEISINALDSLFQTLAARIGKVATKLLDFKQNIN